MNKIRIRRLTRDYELVISELGTSEFVSIKVMQGDPPSQYQITFKLNGIMWDEATNAPKPISEHIVDINLPLGYPKLAPRCTMRTPIWHPNIGDYVCIGDFWSAGVTLADIIAHIADMLQYKSYNLSSPVSKPAAKWAQQNQKSFPIGTKTIRTAEADKPQPKVEIAIAKDDSMEITLGPIREI